MCFTSRKRRLAEILGDHDYWFYENQDLLDDDDVAEILREEYLLNRRKRFAVTTMVIAARLFSEDEEKTRRSRNPCRDRVGPLNFVQTWSDNMFRRQFRITRSQFVDIRDEIKTMIKPTNVEMATLSSGSIVPLETKILITLRILAGASPLDMN